MVSSFLLCCLFMLNTQQTCTAAVTNTTTHTHRKMYKLVECWVWAGVNDQAGWGSSTGTTCDPHCGAHLSCTWPPSQPGSPRGLPWHGVLAHDTCPNYTEDAGVVWDLMPREDKHMNRKDRREEDAVHHGTATNVKSATQSFNSSILETIRNHKLSTATKQSKIIKNHIITCSQTCFTVSNLSKAPQTLSSIII